MVSSSLDFWTNLSYNNEVRFYQKGKVMSHLDQAFKGLSGSKRRLASDFLNSSDEEFEEMLAVEAAQIAEDEAARKDFENFYVFGGDDPFDVGGEDSFDWGLHDGDCFS